MLRTFATIAAAGFLTGFTLELWRLARSLLGH